MFQMVDFDLGFRAAFDRMGTDIRGNGFAAIKTYENL